MEQKPELDTLHILEANLVVTEPNIHVVVNAELEEEVEEDNPYILVIGLLWVMMWGLVGALSGFFISDMAGVYGTIVGISIGLLLICVRQI